MASKKTQPMLNPKRANHQSSEEDQLRILRKWTEFEWEKYEQNQIVIQQQIEMEKREVDLVIFFEHLIGLIELIKKTPDITRIVAFIASFYTEIADNQHLIVSHSERVIVIAYAFDLITAIDTNTRIKFDLNAQGYARLACGKIIEQVKSVLLILECDPDILEIATLMDKSRDKEFAQQVHNRLNL